MGGGAGTVGAANRWNFARIINGKRGCTKLVIVVGTSSGNIALAVYGNTGSGRTSAPGTLKRSVASMACPASGKAEITIASTDIELGDWVGIAADNTTATFLRAAGNVNPQNEGRAWYFNGASLAIPDPVVTTGPVSTTYWVMAE